MVKVDDVADAVQWVVCIGSADFHGDSKAVDLLQVDAAKDNDLQFFGGVGYKVGISGI
ncbi:hypothetical protein JCM15548_14682 [Geofilum rubicundum JCM 15548]|uniref:Uncharacterized protein n=1 Tax=Geofilum rubicundum JCM 15548 TaxID=1236989 RepID=A0A0E9LQD5_9BACT|nr:hypothetical protein JCM15548_14682 [Geofilum rubicundum JCM 15548]